MHNRRKASLVSECLWALALSNAALLSQAASVETASAQTETASPPENNALALEEIVVTAQRRQERLQEVPIAVTAITAEEINNRGLTGPLSLAGAVPNLNLITTGSAALNPFIRGVGQINGGISFEPSVATYVDGVYIASSGAAFTQSFTNIAQISVLKGPQGTLFGRNSTGGVIEVATLDPTEKASLAATLEYGNYETVKSTAYVSSGWSSWAATDLAAYYEEQSDGFGQNLVTGTDNFAHRNYGFRSKTLLTPGESTEIRFTADYGYTSAYSNFQLAPGVVAIDGSTTYVGDYNARNDKDMHTRVKQYGFSLRIDQDFNFARLVSISAYRHNTLFSTFDQDSTPLPVVPIDISQLQHNFSQELQLLSPKESKINWLVGAYYFDSTAGQKPFKLSGAASAPFQFLDVNGIQNTISSSIYAQATTPLTERIKLTTGLRYTRERANVVGDTKGPGGLVLSPVFVQRTNFDKFTWRLAPEYSFSKDVLAYVSWNRGIKSGGFDIFVPQNPGFNPEQLDAYEVGVKSELFDRQMRLNVAGFYYDYRDIQEIVVNAGLVGVINAGKAKMYGLDADLLVLITKNLEFSAGLGLLSAKFKDYANASTFGQQANQPVLISNARGNDTPIAPPVNANGTLTYTVPFSSGALSFSGTVIYNGKSWADPANRLAYPAYTLVNGSVGWNSDDARFGIRLWARNITDERYYADRFASAFGDFQYQAPPRTYGATFSIKL